MSLTKRCQSLHYTRDGLKQFGTMRMASNAAVNDNASPIATPVSSIQASAKMHTIVVPQVILRKQTVPPVRLLRLRYDRYQQLAFALYDAPLWNMALIASRLHLVWIATVCGKLKTDIRYSNTLGWNTFPVPHAHREEQGRPDPLRRGHPAGARGAFPGDDRRSLRSRRTCPPTCARPTSATTRCWSASISAAASATTPSGWKSCSSSTPR